MILTQCKLLKLGIGAGNVLADVLGYEHKVGVALQVPGLSGAAQDRRPRDVLALQHLYGIAELLGSVARRHCRCYLLLSP